MQSEVVTGESTVTEDLACEDLTGRTVLRRSAGGHGTTSDRYVLAFLNDDPENPFAGSPYAAAT